MKENPIIKNFCHRQWQKYLAIPGYSNKGAEREMSTPTYSRLIDAVTFPTIGKIRGLTMRNFGKLVTPTILISNKNGHPLGCPFLFAVEK